MVISIIEHFFSRGMVYGAKERDETKGVAVRSLGGGRPRSVRVSEFIDNVKEIMRNLYLKLPSLFTIETDC